MTWLQCALYPFQSGRIRPGVVQPGWMALAGLFYAAVSGVGFLFVVGLHWYAMAVAAAPLVLALVWLACALTGYCWDVLGRIVHPRLAAGSAYPGWSPWLRYTIEGAQLLAFYALLFAFLGTAALVIQPVREVAPYLLLLFHPVLAAPILFSTRDRTFLGLLDGCLDIPLLFKRNYVRTWLRVTAYTLAFGLVIYPLLAAALLLSVVGWFCLPGLALAYFTGLFCMMADMAAPIAEPLPEATIYTIAEGVPHNPFAIGMAVSERSSADYEALVKTVAEKPNPWRSP